MRRALFALALIGCGTTLRPVATTDAALDLEQVTRGADNEMDPAVSPDGKSLAFTVAASRESAKHVAVVALSDPSRPTYLSRDVLGREPAWMPDGSGIVFVAKRGANAPEKLVQTFGQNEHRPVFLADVGDPNFAAFEPTVAPSGKLVAMSLAKVSVRDSTWPTSKQIDHGIGVTDLGGTDIEVIGPGADPAWSPDGAHIAYVRATADHEHLFVANADGTGAVQITEGAADDRTPSWSPDGKDLVFCSAHGDEELVQANLFVVHADGSGLVQLTEGDHIACHPSWARDGHVYFHANEGGRFHVWRVRVRREG